MPKVLVIEDEPSIRRMLRFSLRDAGFDIIELTTGAEAIRFLATSSPEAVILDLDLADGLAGSVLELLRRPEGNNSSHPAWVMLSALDLEEAVGRCGPLENHFLRKPFDPWNLLGVLEQLLSEKEGV